MRALVLGDDGLRLDAAYPEPKPRGDEAVVRVLRAGICGTDLELLRGYKGFRGVPGHEFVGVVEKCASKPDLVGERVVAEINVGCRRCDRCRRHDERHCAKRTVLGILGRDGAFAEFVAVPVRHLSRVPHVPPEEAVFVEPFAAAIRLLDQVQVTDRTHAVVLGPGRLGRLVELVLRGRTDHVTLAGRTDQTPRDADLVVDCTGSPEGFARAVSLARPGGTVVLKSTCAGDAPVAPALLTELVVREITVVGSRCGTRRDFDSARMSLIGRTIEISHLVEATYRLDDFARAFEHAARPGALKVLLDPS